MRTAPIHCALLLATAALAPPAAAQIGSPPPEFTPVRWINSPSLSLEELRGKAVLIEVFRTWSEQCVTNVPALSARYDKDQKNGLVVIGVSSEPPDAIEPWVRLYKPTYPIVALKGEEFEKALGVRGDYFPISAVIDPEGTLTFSNGLVPGTVETPLSEALAKAAKGALWPKRLEKVGDLIRTGAPDKAWAELKRLSAEKLSESETKAAEKLGAYLAALARDTEAESRKLLEQGRVYEAHERLLPIARAAPPFANAESAAKLLAEIEALSDYKAEMKAGEQFVAAYQLELQMEFVKAVEGYRAILKKYERLRIAGAIRVRIEDLKQRGMLGYVKDCEDCIQKNKACPRHAEKAAKDG